MRLLADENVPGAVVNALRDAGYDIVWIVQQTPGITDSAVRDYAVQENRLLLTFDKDFGALTAFVCEPYRSRHDR